MIGLNIRERSSRLLSLRLGRFQLRILSRIAFAALFETAGLKLMKNFPYLRFASLIDTGFAAICPLARRSRLTSDSCTLAPTFAPRFLQTPPYDDALALCYHFTSIRS